MQEFIHIEFHLLPAIGGDVEDLRVHADGILRADLDAKTTVHAHAQVQVERRGHLLNVGIRMLFGDDVDAARRADGFAHHARNTARTSVFALGEAVTSPGAL